MGDAGASEAYQAARQPLAKCIELDPGHAECHFNLAYAAERTGDDQAALEGYTRALEEGPRVAYFYPFLSELYLVHRLPSHAEAVLRQGLKFVEPTRRPAPCGPAW
jgi:tetratricopeptide (TPR) repeat protein